MANVDIRSNKEKMTEDEVIQIIADALDTPRSQLNAGTKAADVSEWDSMGVLSILASLDREGIKCEIDNTESLQSISGVLKICRSAGRFE